MSNLVTAPWIGARDRLGGLCRISPCRVGDPALLDLHAPRPDFRSAAYQFLIGLLQTFYAPSSAREWRTRWNQPPSAETLAAAFAPYQDAFALENEGPAFLQDLALPADAHQLPVLDLLIDAGSDSNRHFNKAQSHPGLCEDCAALAVLTLQLNAPPGGRGIRTSVRGGGPLTTLLVPAQEDATLWQRLWLNVLPSDELNYPEPRQWGEVLPWLLPTRTSDAQGVGDTTPEKAHPLQAYWGMPRRLRLDASTCTQGDCSVCGASGVRLFQHYRTRHGGTNYTGAWQHPLSPYNLDPKHEKPPLAVKGQRGGIGYRHWLGLALGRADQMPQAAKVVATTFDRKLKLPLRLWCQGYDMDNMKARCWYDSLLPLHAVPPEQQAALVRHLNQFLEVATESAKALSAQVKAARFKRPADAATDPAVQQSFWQGTEAGFYAVLAELVAVLSSASLEPEDVDLRVAPLARQWLWLTRRSALNLFDFWVGSENALCHEPAVQARTKLLKDLNNAKPMKKLWELARQADIPVNQERT
ncbi:MAG: type I-E CRISPR-associated protein Cse1/CasA [Curvibacter lanceolatus]|uniref:type I-E CRISPR-associated protein Cse1/CasA n=1 Tax=Curvibacter lanceolatus TaxID=86182 RepID=UPI00235458CF|nr:type I-E CRISPR-associated protein Cse1/CasA [Curvibacter lanceolatus]MBV5291098.1 type I-E CRISPR-associated protein Cse1/CasA [Curvibacter lanceolatus]